MQTICVIDNSTLVNLTRLHDLRIFESLQLIFASIYVPGKILEEYEKMVIYEPERRPIIDQIRLRGSSFLAFCNKHDSVDLAFLKTTKGIDAGEAEAAAQHKSLFSNFVLSDDKKFIKAIRIPDKHVRILTSLHLLAWLDFAKLVPVCDPYFIRLHTRIKFTSRDLRMAYKEISNYLGIPISKKDLNKKASLTRLGIK